VARSGFTYDVGANIDLDGDSDGTTITVHNDAAASRAKQSSSVLFRPAFAIGQNVLRFELATLQTRSATAVLSQQELAFDNPGDGTLVWMIRVAPGPSLVSAEDLEFGKPTPTSEGLSIAIDRIFTEFIEEHDSIRLFALE
jgi:hypothetical protein